MRAFITLFDLLHPYLMLDQWDQSPSEWNLLYTGNQCVQTTVFSTIAYSPAFDASGNLRPLGTAADNYNDGRSPRSVMGIVVCWT